MNCHSHGFSVGPKTTISQNLGAYVDMAYIVIAYLLGLYSYGLYS